MKNAKLKSDIEDKIASKINEIVKDFKVEGHAISKSIADASKKIAKHIAKKLKEFEKKNTPVKKENPQVIKKTLPAVKKQPTQKVVVKKTTVAIPSGIKPIKKVAIAKVNETPSRSRGMSEITAPKPAVKKPAAPKPAAKKAPAKKK